MVGLVEKVILEGALVVAKPVAAEMAEEGRVQQMAAEGRLGAERVEAAKEAEATVVPKVEAVAVGATVDALVVVYPVALVKRVVVDMVGLAVMVGVGGLAAAEEGAEDWAGMVGG